MKQSNTAMGQPFHLSSNACSCRCTVDGEVGMPMCGSIQPLMEHASKPVWVLTVGVRRTRGLGIGPPPHGMMGWSRPGWPDQIDFSMLEMQFPGHGVN